MSLPGCGQGARRFLISCWYTQEFLFLFYHHNIYKATYFLLYLHAFHISDIIFAQFCIFHMRTRGLCFLYLHAQEFTPERYVYLQGTACCLAYPAAFSLQTLSSPPPSCALLSSGTHVTDRIESPAHSFPVPKAISLPVPVSQM